MANNVHFKETLRNTFLDTINAAIGSGGLLRIYSGTQPATADTGLAGNTLLAELALTASNPFNAAGSGAITAKTISDDTTADNTGTATWATFTTSAGTRIFDVSVGTSGADLNLNTTSIVAGATVSVTSFSLTLTA